MSKKENQSLMGENKRKENRLKLPKVAKYGRFVLSNRPSTKNKRKAGQKLARRKMPTSL